MALSNSNWRRKDDDSSSPSGSASASFFSQDEIGSSLMVNQPNSPISSASTTPIQLSPEKRPLDGDHATPLSFSPKPRPTFSGRARTGSFSGRESKEETPLSPQAAARNAQQQQQQQQQQQGVTMLGGAPVPPGFIPNVGIKRRSEVIPTGRLMPKTGPNSAAAMAAQQQQVQEEKTKNNNPWADIKVLNATTIAQAIHNDGSKSRGSLFSRGSSQPPIGTHQQTQAIVNHVPTTQGNDKQPLLLLRSKSRDDGAGSGSGSGSGAPAPAGTTRMTPLTPKSVKRTPVQRLVPNTTNPDSPLTFIPENNIIRFNKLMLEDVTLESMKATGNTSAASTTTTTTSTTSNPGSGGNTPRQTPTSLSSSTIAAILAQQAAVQKDAQAVNAVYADEELIRKRAESLQYDLHRLQEKKLRSNLRSEEHRLRQETNLDVEHKEAQLLNHLNQSLIQCAEQKDSKVFQCVQFQQELQEKINTLQKMFDKMTNRIGVLEAEFVTCVSSLRDEYSSILIEYYHDPPIVEQKLSSIPHFADVEQLKTTLAAQGVQVVAGRPNMTMTVAEMDGRQVQTDPLTQSRRTSLMMYPHNPANGPAPGPRPGSAAPTLTGRQVSAAPVLQPSSRVSPGQSPNASPPSHARAIQASAQQHQHQAHVAAQAQSQAQSQAQTQAQQFGAAPILRRSSTFSGGVSASILPSGAKRPSISLHPSLMPAAPVRPAASPTSTTQQHTSSPTAAGAGAGATSAGVPPRSPTATAPTASSPTAAAASATSTSTPTTTTADAAPASNPAASS